MKFSDIKICIWDFDGTLYRPNETLFRDVREAECRVIMDHTGWTRKKTMEEFTKLYKKPFYSATAAVAALCNIPVAQSAVESEQYFDRTKYLQRDEKLIETFGKLKNFRHFILANGVIANHKKTLPVLGIPINTFEEIVTSEVVGVTKPDPAGFLYIMKKTGLPPDAHLMVGDRELVDLAPAKKLGMRTCLVWSNVKSTIADITLPDVYSISDLLT